MTIPAQHPARIADLDRAEDGSDLARRVILDRPERVAIRADPTKKGIGLGFVAYDRALQRRHDLLPLFDRQTDLAVEQALPTLINSDRRETSPNSFFPWIVIVHSTATVASSLSKAMVMNHSGLTIRAQTPEKSPVSSLILHDAKSRKVKPQ